MGKKICTFVIFLWYSCGLFTRDVFHVSSSQADEIGKQIWHNECGGSIEGLTHWGEGEEFPSFGIGHFIWYPRNSGESPVVFDEQFPRLRDFLRQHHEQLPVFFQGKCPWRTRSEFLEQFHSQPMLFLRSFLARTVDLQTIFIIRRFKKSMAYMLRAIEYPQRVQVKKQLNRVAQSPKGLYVLIDYLNFKGEGLKPAENYHGIRWGLFQVLTEMKGVKVGKEAVQEFAQCAKKVLARRVKNAPAQRHEERWLPGWYKRIETYL